MLQAYNSIFTTQTFTKTKPNLETIEMQKSYFCTLQYILWIIEFLPRNIRLSLHKSYWRNVFDKIRLMLTALTTVLDYQCKILLCYRLYKENDVWIYYLKSKNNLPRMWNWSKFGLYFQKYLDFLIWFCRNMCTHIFLSTQ